MFAVAIADSCRAAPSQKKYPFDYNIMVGDWVVLGTIEDEGTRVFCRTYLPLNGGKAFSYYLNTDGYHTERGLIYPVTLSDGRVSVKIDFGHGRVFRFALRSEGGAVFVPPSVRPGRAAQLTRLFVHARTVTVTTTDTEVRDTLVIDLEGSASAYAANIRCKDDLSRRATWAPRASAHEAVVTDTGTAR